MRTLPAELLKNTALVMRFHWDASLHHPPGKKAEGQRGPEARKGPRQRSPQEWARRADTKWEEREVEWYGGEKKKLRNRGWHVNDSFDQFCLFQFRHCVVAALEFRARQSVAGFQRQWLNRMGWG